jgi:hypothetical protein
MLLRSCCSNLVELRFEATNEEEAGQLAEVLFDLPRCEKLSITFESLTLEGFWRSIKDPKGGTHRKLLPKLKHLESTNSFSGESLIKFLAYRERTELPRLERVELHGYALTLQNREFSLLRKLVPVLVDNTKSILDDWSPHDSPFAVRFSLARLRDRMSVLQSATTH